MADGIKTRYPSKLYHTDYFTFATNVSVWCGNHAGDPDYPAHLATGFSVKVTALGAALDLWDGLNQAQKGKSAIFTERSTVIAKQLQLIKDLLPTTIIEPPVLADFGLDRKIPEDRDDLFFVAQTCVGHWVDISVPAVPPEYLPLESDFVALQAMFAAFEAAKAEHFAAMNAAQEAQNDVLTTREACHEQERKIFNWYRARHSNTQDEWWTGTWWGASSGGGESGSGTGTSFSDKPIAKIMKAPYPLNGISAGCEEYFGTTRFDYRIAWAQNGEGVQPMPEEDYMTDIEQPTLLDVELMFGYVYYEWIRARKDGEVSEWSDVASYEWNG